jgi:carbamoyltransferase
VALALVDELYDRTGLRDLCLAGGVALNCSMNGRILASGRVGGLFVQPAAGDAGCSLGAALLAAAEGGEPAWRMEHASLGPGTDDDEAERALREAGLVFERVDDPAAAAAELVADGLVVGWAQGRLEFGPRALGNRSILADPRDPDMHRRVNEAKQREQWRPLAPSVLEEEAGEWFELGSPSPFMLLAVPVREERRAEVPAVVHVDGTARPQTVGRSAEPRYRALIAAFARETGVPLVLNTSFNGRGEPIVRTPREAVGTFLRARLDALVIGGLVARRGS